MDDDPADDAKEVDRREVPSRYVVVRAHGPGAVGALRGVPVRMHTRGVTLWVQRL